MSDGGQVIVLVVTHKVFDDSFLDSKEGYHVIAVGNRRFNESKNWIADDMGENISSENRYYCELTAQYWGWKNLNDPRIKYVGISHYRRYFFDYKKSSKDYKDDILSESRILEILQSYKIIIPYLSVKTPGYSMLYEHVPKKEQDKYWVLMESIINEHFCEYADDFHEIVYGKYIAYGNMFITSKKYFDEYSKWLFSVLGYYDAYIEKQGEERIDRLDGYLSEMLLLVWVRHNFHKKDIYSMEVRNIESDSFSEYSKTGFKNRFRRMIHIHRNLLCLYRQLGLYYMLWRKK